MNFKEDDQYNLTQLYLSTYDFFGTGYSSPFQKSHIYVYKTKTNIDGEKIMQNKVPYYIPLVILNKATMSDGMIDTLTSFFIFQV
jgi:hypothetical protein